MEKGRRQPKFAFLDHKCWHDRDSQGPARMVGLRWSNPWPLKGSLIWARTSLEDPVFSPPPRSGGLGPALSPPSVGCSIVPVSLALAHHRKWKHLGVIKGPPHFCGVDLESHRYRDHDYWSDTGTPTFYGLYYHHFILFSLMTNIVKLTREWGLEPSRG